MIKFKIFTNTQFRQLEQIVNQWIKDNPNVEIVNYQFTGQSMCIMYR